MIKRLLRLVGRWARKPVNHTSWVAVVTPTDRPKSVRNRCLIELFCGVVCVVTLPFWHFCWCRGFCHRTESDLFLFLLQISLYNDTLTLLVICNIVLCRLSNLYFHISNLYFVMHDGSLLLKSLLPKIWHFQIFDPIFKCHTLCITLIILFNIHVRGTRFNAKRLCEN